MSMKYHDESLCDLVDKMTMLTLENRGKKRKREAEAEAEEDCGKSAVKMINLKT